MDSNTIQHSIYHSTHLINLILSVSVVTVVSSY